MLSKYILQIYVLFYLAFLVYPDVANPPLYFLSAFFLTTNIWMFLLLCAYLIILEDFEREIGSHNFAYLYLMGAIAGNISLLSIYFDTAAVLPIMGASSGILALFGAYIARHPYELAIFEGLPMLAIMGLILLTVGHIVLFGKLDFLPIIVGVAYGYLIPKNPIQQKRPPQPMYAGGRY